MLETTRRSSVIRDDDDRRPRRLPAVFECFVAATAIVLGIGWLFRAVPPLWLFHLLNPVGWLCNATHLTSLRPGIFVGVADTLMVPGRWIGLPVAGGLLCLQLVLN